MAQGVSKHRHVIGEIALCNLENSKFCNTSMKLVLVVLDSSDQPSPSLLPPLVVYGNIMVMMRRGRLFRGHCSNVESLNNVNMHLPTAILLHLERER